jgi:glycosyltransferase involved in cell wall biosynthesis
MRCPTLADLPRPPGKTGWPWTIESPQLPDTMPGGSAWPRITIVTPSFNQGEFIEETIRSVLLQGYPDLQYIIMDGGSNDGTVDILRKYEPWFAHMEIKKDRGQAHAINKGYELGSGDIFQWINSDDFLYPGVLKQISENCPLGGCLAGGMREFGANWEHVNFQANLSIDNLLVRSGPAVWLQPSFWITKKVGGYAFPLNEQLHFAFDWEMLLRILVEKVPIAYIPTCLVNFRHHQASKTVSLASCWRNEYIEIHTALSLDPKFAPYHRKLQVLLHEDLWRKRIEELCGIATIGSFARLSAEMFASPLRRIDRFTLGALRRLLLRTLPQI